MQAQKNLCKHLFERLDFFRGHAIYELPITEIYIYVNSMADCDAGDSESLQWKLWTNSYECNLVDKQSNVVKLMSIEGENFHKQIVLRLELHKKK